MAKKGTSAQLWNRSIVVMILIIAVGFGVVAARLLYLQTFMAEELQKRAVEQQLVNTELTAKRGSIYDCNGNVLAQSVTVWDIVMEPANIKDEYGMIVAEGLHEILGTDVQKVYEQTKENHYYAVVKRKVDTDVKDKVMNFNSFLRKEYNIANALKAVENYRRFYTHDNFLADVLGFVGADSQGLAGLEYQYDDYLIGKKGRLMVATNAAGGQMPYEYEQKIDAIDGYNLTLSVDEYIQSVMEKYVRETIAEFRVANRGCAIMMNVKTGAILGFACEGSFNPNDPFEIADEGRNALITRFVRDQCDCQIRLPEQGACSLNTDKIDIVHRLHVHVFLENSPEITLAHSAGTGQVCSPDWSCIVLFDIIYCRKNIYSHSPSFREIRVLQFTNYLCDEHDLKMCDHIPEHVFLILHFGKNAPHKECQFLNIHFRREKTSLSVDLMPDVVSENFIVRIKLFQNLMNIKVHPFPAGLLAESVCCMQFFRWNQGDASRIKMQFFLSQNHFSFA